MNALKLSSLNLYDTIRKNKRQNSLLVLDFEIPNLYNITTDGLISFSYLNSAINKDVIRYHDGYALNSNSKNHTSSANNSQIEVNTRTLKIKQTFFSNIHFDAYMSSSRSTNDQQTYSFNFSEPHAYTESTNNLPINKIFEVSKNDTSFTGLDGYSFDYYYSNELEKTYGVNLQYDFRITKYLAGKIKVGNKFRTKTRT